MAKVFYSYRSSHLEVLAAEGAPHVTTEVPLLENDSSLAVADVTALVQKVLWLRGAVAHGNRMCVADEVDLADSRVAERHVDVASEELDDAGHGAESWT